MSAHLSPSGEGRGPPRALIALIAVILAVRLIAGASLHLTEDEAYYRLWSMAPAFGYYDHPPMIAWWIWLGRHLAGDTPLGVRLIPSLASAVTSFLVFDLARLAGAERTVAARAMLWFNAMLLVAAGGFLAVPDAPAMLFWTAALGCVMRALRDSSIRWWLAAGLMAGLATLSKYSSLFLGPGILIWLIAVRPGRAALKTPGPWLAMVIAAMVFGVNVAWNAQHHWLTFDKQFGRIAATHLAPQHLAELILTQIILINPLIAVFVIGAARVRDRAGAALAPFLLTSAPFVLYLVLHSLHDRVQPHWPALVYPALAICAAVGAERLGQGAFWRRMRVAAPVFGLMVCVLALICLAVPARLFPARLDPVLPVRGWPVFAGRIEAMRVKSGAAWVGTMSYGLAAQLKDEPALTAPLMQMTEADRYDGLRMGAAPDLSKPGLVVDLERRMSPALLARCFTVVQPLASLDRGHPGEKGKRYAVILVSGRRLNCAL